MKHESTDLRVRRTLKAIRTALYELILERPYRQISITELTSRAGINRKTFYLHYPSLNELINEVKDEIVNEILELLRADSDTDSDKSADISSSIRIFYHYLADADEIHTKLLCDAEYHFFYESVVQSLLATPYFLRFYENTEHPNLVRAYCAAITSIYRTWNETPGDLTLDELVDYTCRIMLDGYNGIV